MRDPLYSVSSINQKEYLIPNDLDDSLAIEDFLSKNKDKKVIVVQGLGFVGAVMALVCANALTEEYAVIGIDLPNEGSFWKIKSINEGIFPVIADDPNIEIFFKKAIKKGNLFATYDSSAFKYADVVIVDINLDVQKKSAHDYSIENFDVDMSGFENAVTEIGKNISEDVLILVETTVPPGTCQNIVKPIIEKELQKRKISLKKFSLGHSYERVMPGPEYIDSIRSYPRVYSGIDDKSADHVEVFLKTIIDTNCCELTRLEHTNATEIAKVLENSYRATNIAFAVEWSRFAEEAGVNLYDIVNAIRVRNTHSNLMYPGIGVGGYCLTKDPLLASWARKYFFDSENDLDMSINSVSINDRMPMFAYQRLKNVFGNLKNLKIAFFGVSYRGDVGDTRYTPVKVLFDLIKKEGASIFLHDPYVTFWEEQEIEVNSSIDDMLSIEPDIIIISTGHKIYSSEDMIQKLDKLNKKTKIFDTVGTFSKQQLKKLSKNHQISVLGRGDF